MSFKEVDRQINELVQLCVELEAIVKKASEFGANAIDAAREAALQAEIARIHADAEVELQKSVVEYRDWESKFARKARLFEKGGLN